jgi:hypothetical protein
MSKDELAGPQRTRDKIAASLASEDYLLGVNTSKQEKAQPMARVVAAILGLSTDTVQPYSPQAAQNYVEPWHQDARVVSQHKALQVQRALVTSGTQHGPVVAGADVSFAVKLPSGSRHLPKLERLGRPLEEEELQNVLSWMVATYVMAPEIQVEWQVAVTVANGHSLTESERVQVVSGPVDLELLETYFWYAKESGLLYTSNSWLPLIEMLIANGRIKTVTVVHENPPAQGGMKDVFTKHDKDALKQIFMDIVSTTPGLLRVL